MAASVKIIELPGPPAKGDVSDWIKAVGTVEQLATLAETAPEWEPKAAPNVGAGGPDSQGSPYFVHAGALHYNKPTKDKIIAVRLTNFTAQCVAEITRDDGVERVKEFVMTGALESGKKLPEISLKSGDFAPMTWISKQWGLEPNITAGAANKDHVRCAIQTFSKAEQKTVYNHTGWRKINGTWHYLHVGGAIGATSDVAVDLVGDNLQGYRLPDPGGLEAAQASLRFLDVGPWEITAPLLACVYLAPFASLCRVNFTLWAYGESGSMKSTMAALALSHFGAFGYESLPGSWLSTVNSLEKLCFTLKDSLVVIDDFIPAKNAKEAHRMAEAAARIIYQAGNLSSRGRLRQDLTEQPNWPPRGLMVSTGEMLLPGGRQSATARYMGVKFDQDMTPIDKGRLTVAQNEAHLLAQAMAAYLRGLCPRLDDAVADIKSSWLGYRTAFQSGAHLRVPEIQAWFAVGFELFLQFQTSMGAITPAQAADMEKRAWQVFKSLGEKQAKIIAGEKPALKFMAVLQELFAQGKIYVRSTTSEIAPPPGAHGLGWGFDDDGGPARNAEMIGWADETHLYLMPGPAYQVVHRALEAQGDHLGLGKNDLLAALASENLIVPGKNNENSWNKKIL